MRRRFRIANQIPVEKLPQSEADFQEIVLDLADVTGWSYWHFPKAAYKAAAGAWSRDRQINKGWPDLVLMRLGKKPRLVFLELKGSKTPVTPEQVAVNEGLRLCGQEAYILSLKDWDELVKVLQR